ncbi:hypothetical protein BO71DRAFT_484904 [Aspergillus ellipticus CBS 707.79]|uniref:C2H2-type domain-containing protein n=1 Tax=Aspergillus ellipticus CBS 707.79 TaxID=1448320 RepID=A0A319D794_9EURO|nr:hypothetical protein BO71DRAFT_484904 [Aspergillus ellipticus CBS 707.79]
MIVRPFKCENCPKVFTRQENLRRHEQTHHQQSARRSYQCPHCSASFLRSDLRKRHIRNCHPLTEFPQSSGFDFQWESSIENQLPLPSLENSSPPLRPNAQNPTHSSTVLSEIPRPPFEIANDAEGSSFSQELLYSESYFSHFHPTFPIIHKPSFDAASSPEPLRKAIAAIGALYDGEGNMAQSRSLFESGYQALDSYVRNDRTKFQSPWVIPAYLILETFGMYSCHDQLFLKAQNIHRGLVDAVRELQMTRDRPSGVHRYDFDSPEESDGVKDSVLDDRSVPLVTRWRSFVHAELRKRTIYCLHLLDSQLSIICNVRPLMSALEIKFDLPCSDELWDAATAEEWDMLRNQQLSSSFNDQEDEYGFQGQRPPLGTFHESMQHLLQHGSQRMSNTLCLLWSSPFTALVLVTQLQMMSRDLTHANCLLERSMGPQPHVSVLLDNQYGQIAQALRNILDLTPRGNPASTITPETNYTVLWHSFWMMWHYTSITLTHPCALLVTGTVESNLPAAIATAGYLGRPRAKKHRDIYEDRDVFRILNDLEPTMQEINALHPTEHPFTTFLGYKTCLIGWRVVRLMVCKASRECSQRGAGAGQTFSPRSGNGSLPYRHSPAEYVLRRVGAHVLGCGSDGVDGSAGSEEVGKGGEREGDRVSYEGFEREYLGWARRAFVARRTWPVGKWQAAIVEESIAWIGEIGGELGREVGGGVGGGSASAGVGAGGLSVGEAQMMGGSGEYGVQREGQLDLTELEIIDPVWMGAEL